jgi:putative resolvase
MLGQFPCATALKSRRNAPYLTVSQAALFYQVHPQTIRRWTRTGKLSCTRTLGHHRRFTLPTNSDRKVVAYARVSTHDQKKDLETQEQVLRQQKPDVIIKDLGSGMNYRKSGFLKLLGLIVTRQIKELILTRKDRLLRFGSEIIFFLCQHFGGEGHHSLRNGDQRTHGTVLPGCDRDHHCLLQQNLRLTRPFQPQKTRKNCQCSSLIN